MPREIAKNILLTGMPGCGKTAVIRRVVELLQGQRLMVIMRHKDFATTRMFYGARRAAQAAATEIHRKLVIGEKAEELVCDVEQLGKLTADEMKTLKRLLKSLRQPAESEQSSP